MQVIALFIVTASLASCGGKAQKNSAASESENATYVHASEPVEAKTGMKLMEGISSRTEVTMSTIGADQMHTIALSQLPEGSGEKWSPVFGDRFSLSTAGIIPFPSHHGNISHQPTLFHALIGATALNAAGNSLNCRSSRGEYRHGCPTVSLCRNILTNLDASKVSDKSIQGLYFYLVGDDLSGEDLQSLKLIAQKASQEQSTYPAMEIVCFTILQSPKFLSY